MLNWLTEGMSSRERTVYLIGGALGFLLGSLVTTAGFVVASRLAGQ